MKVPVHFGVYFVAEQELHQYSIANALVNVKSLIFKTKVIIEFALVLHYLRTWPIH